MSALRALLLIGPTGSGKTPLGELLERDGLWGKRCLHFDFGASLRLVANADAPPAGLSHADVAAVQEALCGGLLLENEHFDIAGRILMQRLREAKLTERDLLVLNGLPRHVGQAQDVDRLVHTADVVCLDCAPEVVRARIELNAGGDRTERTDDSAAEVASKLQLFQERTAPLLRHYREMRARLHTLTVTITTDADQMRHTLEETRREEPPLR